MRPQPGDKIIVKTKDVCQKFLHESTKYPRKGYQKEDEPRYTVEAGEEVEFVEDWINFFGAYWRIKNKDGMIMDIDPNSFK